MAAGPTERIATSNEAALRFRLRADGIADLADHAALRQLAAIQPAAFQAVILDFAGFRVTGDDAVPWPADVLARALNTVLLDADLRPDDRLLVAGLPPWPWVVAETQGIAVILAPDATPQSLRAVAITARATAVAAPATWLAAAGLTGEATPGPRAVCMDGLP